MVRFLFTFSHVSTEDNRQAVYDTGLITQLVTLLKHTNEFLQLQTVWALSYVSNL